MKKYLLFLTCSAVSCIAFSQVNIPVNGLVKENFNAIGSAAGASLPASWKMSSAGTGAASGYTTGTNVTVTTQAASSGAPTAGGRYNWATTAGTDRAIGFMSDGGYADGNAIFADYKNTTGATITSVTLSFNIERYRINTGAATVSFFYSINGTSWTAASAGDISGGVFTPGASSYTFTSPQTVYKKLSIGSLSIATGSDLYLRWVFTTGGTNAQGLALDDVVLFAQTATPVVTGSLRDNLLLDVNSSGQADAGDQLRYTTVIRNTGTGDATGVALNNPTPANTTLNPGSVKTSALARDDNYTTGINTLLSGTTVLANDFGMPTPTVTTFGSVADPTTTVNGANTAKTDNGGTVLMNTDGTFSYTPPTGFTGFDRFAYIATTGTAPDNAGLVTIAVGSSVITPGAPESYNVAGNISITTPNSGTGNLLNNDVGNSLAIASVNGSAASIGNPITTTNGGTLTVNSNGSFTYNPAPGYEGADNFTYTIDNGFSTASAPVTVTLTIAGMVWFIDNNYSGSLSDGRLGSPFKTIPAFQAVNNGSGNNPAVNDNIFIYESAADYNGNISLLNGQKLIGQDATAPLATISGITLPLYSAAFPVTNSGNGTIVNLTTTAAATDAVTLLSAANNMVRGLTIGNTTGAKLFSTGFGTLTIGNNTIPDVALAGTGQAMNLTGGTFAGTSGFISVTSTGSTAQGINLSAIAGTVSFGSTNISGTATQGILVGTTTANIDFGNTTVSSGTDGVSLQNNSAGTRTFGTLNITTPAAANAVGFLHANGGGIVNAGVTTINNQGGSAAGIDITGNTTALSFGNTTLTKSGTGTGVNLGSVGSPNSGNISFTGLNISMTPHSSPPPGPALVSTENTGLLTVNGGTISNQQYSATPINITKTTGTTPVNLNFSNVDLTLPSSHNSAMILKNVSGSITITGGSLAADGTTATLMPTVDLTGGSVNLNCGGVIRGSIATCPLLMVSNGHTGTVNFTNSFQGGGPLKFDNADGVYNFTGNYALSNGAETAILIMNGSDGNFNFGAGISIPLSFIKPAIIIGGTTNTANFTFNGNITNNSSGQGPLVSITNHTTGTITFQTGTLSSVTVGNSNACSLDFDNADGIYNFNGTTTLNGGGAGINIRNGSDGQFTFGSGTSISCAAAVFGTIADTLFSVIGGTASVAYNGSLTQGNIFPAVAISGGHTTGTIAFNGAIGATNGTGLRFDNADGTYNFTGVVTLNGGDAGIDVLNGSAGTINISNTSSKITNPTNELIKVNAGTANLTYSGAFTKTNNTNGILISGETGGIININGSGTKTITNTTANAINLTGNTGATINFSGNNLLLTTTSGTGFNATGGGTVSVAGTGNTISSTTGTALNVANTTISSGNLNFLSISAGTAAIGPALGINLNTTGSAGGLTVSGTGTTAGSGGTIQKCNHGVFANSSSNLTLANMNIINNGLNQTAAGSSSTVGGDLVTGNNLSAVANITLFSVTSAALTNLSVTGSSQIGINGNAVNGLTIANCTVNNNGNESFEGGVMLQNASGTLNITGTSVRDNRARELHISNGSGTMTFNTSASQYGHTNSGTGTAESQQGILMQLYGTSNSTINASSITVSNNEGVGFTANGFQINADNGGPIVNGGVSSSVFDNNAAHVFVNAGGTSNVTFNTTNNSTMTRADLQAINYTILGGSAAITASLTGTISGNNIGTAAVTGCKVAGGNCHAMDFNTGSNWAGQMHVRVSANSITNTDVGIFFTLEGAPAANAVTPQVHAKINNNVITNSSAPLNGEALKLNAAVTSANPKLFVCWDAGGTGQQNTISGNWATGASQASVYLRHRFTGNASIQLPGYGGSSTDDAAVTTYLNSRNAITNGPAAGQTPVFVSHGAGLTPFVGGAACTTP